MSIHNNLGYNFSPQSIPLLLEFLDAVKNQNKSFCSGSKDLDVFLEHSTKQIEELRNQALQKEISVIDLCDSDEEMPPESNPNLSEELNTTADKENSLIDYSSNKNLTISTTNDITAAIKESLYMKNVLKETIDDLRSCSAKQLQEVFVSLQELQVEDICSLGRYICISDMEEIIIINFLKILLLPKIQNEYFNNIQLILKHIDTLHRNILISELVSIILVEDSINCKVFIKYVTEMSEEFKLQLLRNLITAIEKLNEAQVTIIESLINENVGLNSLKKLVAVMTNSADDFSINKSFGKLLLNVLNLLGSEVSNLEQLLKYVVGSHRSIWKSKIQKIFNEHFQDSMLMTQSGIN